MHIGKIAHKQEAADRAAKVHLDEHVPITALMMRFNLSRQAIIKAIKRRRESLAAGAAAGAK